MNNIEILTGHGIENYLFPFFWQHGENLTVLGKYMEAISGCGMKGVCIEARPHPDFLSDGWWRDMDFILDKAKELGMKLWILDDAHFPTGYANGRVKEAYPQYLKWYLAMRRYDVQGPLKGARIDFGLLKGRPWDRPDPSEQILHVIMAQRMDGWVAGDGRSGFTDSILPDTLTDITGQMCMEDRLLTLDVPDGSYSIFVLYLTRNGGEEATRDYLNPLIKEATQILIEEVYEPHYRHYKEEFGTTIQGFFSDEPRFGNKKGTDGAIGQPDMVLPWRGGLETSLDFDKKYLPLLWIDGGGAESLVRGRYMNAITRLYHENFTKVLGDWCRARNVFYLGHTIEDNGAHARLGYGTGHYFRGQQGMDFAGIDVIGGQIVPGMNYHHDAFNTGGSNGEFYHYALAKLASSAAHLEPEKKGRCMCEAFGAYGWNEGLKMMKWIADHLLVRGVNYLVPHAFNPKTFPDADCPPHFYAHGHNPQFRYFRIFSDYVNRVAGLFRNGIHPAKVGILYPAEIEWAGAYMPVEKPAAELTRHQISFDIVTLDYLQTAEFGTGTYTINGVSLSVLVIPRGECLPEGMAPVLEKLKAVGVRIIWLEQKPARAIGITMDFVPDCGEVVQIKDLGKTLSPFAAFKTSTPQPGLVAGEYERDGKKFFMVFNEHIGRAVHTRLTIREEGVVYRYDAFTDRLSEVKKQEPDIQLNLEPYESAIFVVCNQPLPVQTTGSYLFDISQDHGWLPVPLPTDWTVRYADSFSYPTFTEEVPVRRLRRIEALAGWDKKAGTLRYEAELLIQDTDCGAGSRSQAVLDLGKAYETAEVFVDGISAGVRICQPYRFDLTDLIHQGKNLLAIEVTNTLGTATRDPLSHYLMIEPFGIEGPVELKIR